jgi:signal transduction histidine kinase
MIPLYALSSILASIAIVGLGIVSLVHGRRDRIRVTFALYCFAWSLIPLAGTAMQLTPSGPQTWARATSAAVFVASFFAMLYVLALTGKRLRDSLGPLRVGHYVVGFAVFSAFAATAAFTSGLVVRGVVFHPLSGYSLRFAPTAPLVQVPLGLLSLVWINLLAQTIEQTENLVERRFLRSNLVGTVAIIGCSGVFAVLLPVLGVSSFVVAFDAFALIAFYFYVVIANHQFQKVEELAETLERRVEERTSELKRAQTRLVQAEKMASLGALVAGVAHEMNTPLGAVRSMNDTRARAVTKLELRVAELFGVAVWSDKVLERSRTVIHQGDQVISEGLERIEKIVAQLKSFARLDQADLETVELHGLIEDTLGVMNTRLAKVQLLRRYGDPIRITCVPRQINQVFFNLLANALDAVGGEGTIALFTDRDGEHAVVRIVDDGTGIQPEHLERVFDPGFTTKGAGVGTGLGLAICYQILHEHGGDIAIESAPGVGTKVKIRLPIAARLIVRAGSSPSAASNPPMPSRH